MAAAVVGVDLRSQESRLVLTVDNPTNGVLHVRVGPQSGAAKDVAIGDVRIQAIGGGRLEGGPGYKPFVPRSLVVVDSQCRASFFVDAPLGREPKFGDYVVLLIEVGAPDAKPAQRLLPLVTATPNRG